jgi:hypothetical protein
MLRWHLGFLIAELGIHQDPAAILADDDLFP